MIGRSIRRFAAQCAAAALLCSASPSSHPFVTLEYSRITAGGGDSQAGACTVRSAIEIHNSAFHESSDRFTVVSVSVFGNNGVATALGATAVRLSWLPSDLPGLAGYIIVRSDNPNEGFIVIAVLNTDATWFTDENLAPSSTFYYRIYATDSQDRLEDISGLLAITTADGPNTGVESGWMMYE